RCLREGNWAAVPVLVHGTDAELHVVLGDVERDPGDVADGRADVQSGSVVSRITTSYPVRLVSVLAFQVRVERLVPAKPTGGVVWICTFLGVAGEVASAHSAAAFTPVTRAT